MIQTLIRSLPEPQTSVAEIFAMTKAKVTTETPWLEVNIIFNDKTNGLTNYFRNMGARSDLSERGKGVIHTLDGQLISATYSR